MKIIKEDTAWNLIGYEEKNHSLRIKGGKALYETVQFNCATRGNKVLLSKLVSIKNVVGQCVIRQVDRYVNPDTVIEIIED